MDVDHNIFPNESYSSLKIFADRMGKEYDFIEEITVYYANFQTHRQVIEWDVKYIMLFQLPFNPKPGVWIEEDELSFRINVFRDLFEEFNGPPKVDDVFFPKTHEWKFIIRYRGENVPVGISEDEPHWLLFKNESTILNDLLTQAKTEIEPLFAAIKEIGFSARNLDANDENWMHATLQYFDGNQTHFNLVRKKYLQDKNLYAFAPGQEARDFKGCLLEKIVKGNGLEENNPGARNLVKLYREIG